METIDEIFFGTPLSSERFGNKEHCIPSKRINDSVAFDILNDDDYFDSKAVGVRYFLG